jgi:MFS family permease
VVISRSSSPPTSTRRWREAIAFIAFNNRRLGPVAGDRPGRGIEAGTSLAVRPVAGILADRANRQLVAAVGAALYAASFVVYALAPGIVVVGLGAAVGGAGGALFWVALRADVGARLEQDPAAYARLLSSEQAGSLAAFVIGLSLLGSIGYRPLFLVGAAACVAAMVLLLGEARYRPAARW